MTATALAVLGLWSLRDYGWVPVLAAGLFFVMGPCGPAGCDAQAGEVYSASAASAGMATLAMPTEGTRPAARKDILSVEHHHIIVKQIGKKPCPTKT